MSRLVFDCEANGLLKEATDMWLLYTYDLDTGEKTYWEQGFDGWKKKLSSARLLVGHNIIGYDLPLLRKLYDFELPESVNVHDTLVLSRVLDYRRFGYKGHSLDAWGDALNFRKIYIPDKANFFKQYSPEMLEYCERDVMLNVKVYDVLMKEYRELSEREPNLKYYLRSEQAVADWQIRAETNGWPFDVERGFELFDTLENELKTATERIEPKLGKKAVIVDRLTEATKKRLMEKGVDRDLLSVLERSNYIGGAAAIPKSPKWVKNGFYDSHTASWFAVPPESGYAGEERLIEGPFCRVKFENLKLSSVADVKLFLSRNGWKPTEWNTKVDPDTGERLKTSPKITDDDLELLGGDGALYKNYVSASSRYSILKTWLENVDWAGYLHGDSNPIGTPSMRMTHNVIVNVPSVDSLWGREMRELFICPEGWKIVGCDSAGNQARGLAFFLNDEEFIDVILHKDIHLYNAKKLIEVLDEMGMKHDFTPESIRPNAKRILYAFLFGASGKKLWGYLFGVQNVKMGNKLKKGFVRAVPGFNELLDKLSKIYGKTSQDGYGYIPSLVGTKIYVDSFHKLLVYLLQSTEKITCSAAVMLTMDRLRKEKIPYKPLIIMHDEFQCMAPEEYAERVREIGIESFKEGPKLFGIDIMDGDGKVGNSWYETH